MSDGYSYGAGGVPGGAPGNPRDRITQALMNVQNPPPGGPIQPGGMPPQPSPSLSQRPLPPAGAMPQSQPAGFGAVGPPAGPLAPFGGPYQQGLNLPGITPPGMLPRQ